MALDSISDIYMAIVIQARTKSKRLPGKVLKELCGAPLIQHVIENCQKITSFIIVAIPEGDNHLIKWLKENNHLYFEGPEKDVLSRYCQCVKKYEIDHVMRITADSPFVDPAMMNYCTSLYRLLHLDFITNAFTAPDGQEVEIFSKKALAWAWNHVKDDYDREHVTTYIKSHLRQFENDGLSLAIVQSPFHKTWFPKMSIDTEYDLSEAENHMKFLKNQAEQLNVKLGLA